LTPEFKTYAEMVVANAKTLAAHLSERGVKIVSGGTDNHLMLIDLRESPLSGKDAEERLGRIGLTVNKNTVPGETRKPMVTSGIRIGTPAITTRGLKPTDMKELAESIYCALQESEGQMEHAKGLVTRLCQKYPLYDGVFASAGYAVPRV